MQLYPAFRFHQGDPDNNPPRKVLDDAEDAALKASGPWADQPFGNPPAPAAGHVGPPIAGALVAKDTGLTFPKFLFHPNGNATKVASPAEEEALKLESADWQPAPCDEATIAAYRQRQEGGTTAPVKGSGPGEANTGKAATSGNGADDAATGANTLSAAESIALAEKATAADLAVLEKAEKLRQNPRTTVTAAIEARYAALQAAQLH